MITADTFLPQGFLSVTAPRPGGGAPLMTEREFALLDEQKAFLKDDYDYGDNPAATLYPIMLEAHTCFPFEWYCPPTITQAMACIVAETMESGDNLVIYGWDLLPAAVLLTSRFPNITVSLQVGGFSKAYPPFDYKPIITLLQRVFKHMQTTWATLPHDELPHGATTHILGLSPFQVLKLGMLDISAIRAAKTALFVVYWSALRGKRLRKEREDCAKAGIFRGIVQLPPTERAGQTYQFACIEMGNPERFGQHVRMARAAADDQGTGEPSADSIVALLRGPADDDANIKMTPHSALGDNLTPEALFTNLAIGNDAIPLGDMADILRFQVTRTPVPFDRDKPVWGALGGDFFARDIRLQDLDPVTGFVPVEDTAGNYVRLPAKEPADAYARFMLKENDIIFAFRGAETSLGGVGFVAETGNFAIPGQIMCIIRAVRKDDAVWLYHYLRQPAIREWVLRNSAGAGVMKTLTTSVVANIPILKPGRLELNNILAYHQNLVAVAGFIRQQRQSMQEQLLKIDANFNLPEGVAD